MEKKNNIEHVSMILGAGGSHIKKEKYADEQELLNRLLHESNSTKKDEIITNGYEIKESPVLNKLDKLMGFFGEYQKFKNEFEKEHNFKITPEDEELVIKKVVQELSGLGDRKDLLEVEAVDLDELIKSTEESIASYPKRLAVIEANLESERLSLVLFKAIRSAAIAGKLIFNKERKHENKV